MTVETSDKARFENLLPLNIIKQICDRTACESAELSYQPDGSVCVCLINGRQRFLIARKQGDISRTWKSADTAIKLIKSNFAISRINIEFEGECHE